MLYGFEQSGDTCSVRVKLHSGRYLTAVYLELCKGPEINYNLNGPEQKKTTKKQSGVVVQSSNQFYYWLRDSVMWKEAID